MFKWKKLENFSKEYNRKSGEFFLGKRLLANKTKFS